MGVDVGVLGPMRVQVDSVEVSISAAKERAVLAVLALRAGRSVSTAELIEAVWAGREPLSAPKLVQTYVSHLRRMFPAGLIETVAGGYRADLPPDAVDALRFAHNINEAAAMVESEPARAARLLSEALGCWRGPPLTDLVDGAFGVAEVARLEELRRTAEELSVDARLILGEHVQLVGDLEASVAEEPLRERRWAQLITALFRCGRQGDALRAYQRARLVLREELGVEPGDALRVLEAAVLAHDPSLDFSRPRGDRLVIGRPLRWSGGPRASDRLIGRDGELAHLIRVLDEHWLVTLTGVGGVGKTRLARAAAEALLSEFPDGVGWADLAALSDGTDVVRAVADATGVVGQPGVPLIDALCGALAARRMLVVLDNCEHVRSSAADAATEIGVRCPETTLLTTSRERLGVEGERTVMVVPLATAGRDSPAVELLRSRLEPSEAGDRYDSDRLLEIAEQLDGLPLALELAAARCRSLGVAAVADRLGDVIGLLADRMRRTGRHRTLEAALSWSYDLLSPDERCVLDQLSLFAATFSLGSAEEVGAARGFDRAAVDGIVASLVDKSLVAREGGRFWMLETTRQFAAGKLRESAGAADAVRAYTAHVLARVIAIHAGLRGPDEAEWVAACDALWPDVRSVVRCGFDEDDAETVIAILVHVGLDSLYRRVEALAWTTDAVARWADRPGPHHHELLGLGGVATYTMLDVPTAISLADQAIAADPCPGTAIDCLPQAALGAYYFAGNIDPVTDAFNQALTAARANGDLWRQVLLLSAQSYGLSGMGDTEGAAAAAADALDAAERLGNPTAIAGAGLGLAGALATSDPGRAAIVLDRSRAAAHEVRNQWVLAMSAALLHVNSAAGPRSAQAVDEMVEAADQLHAAGWATHAWWVMWNAPSHLHHLGRGDDAAVLLGGCEASGVGRLPAQTVPAELESLSSGTGTARLLRLYDAGSKLALPAILRILAGVEPLPDQFAATRSQNYEHGPGRRIATRSRFGAPARLRNP